MNNPGSNNPGSDDQGSNNQGSDQDHHISLLSQLMFLGYAGDFAHPLSDLRALESLRCNLPSEEHWGEFLNLANTHHVTVRALRVLEQMAADGHDSALQQRCHESVEQESVRIRNAVEWLYAIVQALQNSGCPVSVIKSLDHWPDLGSDLDLYTSGAPEQVTRVMREKLQARLESRSWGDRLASKWNFQLPGLPELVEVHVRYLGQTGEQNLMARRVLERRVTKAVNDHTFPVPALEERILISTLQRMYRHFYFRLCDMADVAVLLESGTVDFAELQRGAELGSIWPGVASFLVIVSQYVKLYGGHLDLPDDVVGAAYSPELRVQFRDNFLRVPIGPAAGLYGSQLLSAGRHRDLRAISRLPLLPPLAVSALLAYRFTGSDKGVW